MVIVSLVSDQKLLNIFSLNQVTVSFLAFGKPRLFFCFQVIELDPAENLAVINPHFLSQNCGCKAVSYTHLDVYKRQARLAGSGHRGQCAGRRATDSTGVGAAGGDGVGGASLSLIHI